jgi:hypothetical protein
LQRDNHPDAATFAREVLKTMRSSLDLMQRHLRATEERKNLAREGPHRIARVESAGVYS